MKKKVTPKKLKKSIMTKNELIPTEDEESKLFVEWLTIMDIPHHHSANEVPVKKMTGRGPNGKPIWTSNWTTLRRLKAMGVSSGFPDYIIVIPAHRSVTGKALLLAIEMKRVKGGTTSPEQKVWLSLLSEVRDCEGVICRGFDAARETVKKYLNF